MTEHEAVALIDSGRPLAGRYRLQHVVAEGAAGWVFRGRDEEVDVEVAIKLFDGAMAATQAELARVAKVMNAYRAVHHPTLVRIYDFGEDSGRAFYTMPFLDGMSLREVIDVRLGKGLTFTLTEVLPLFGQLVEALQALASVGPHGAIRPTTVSVLSETLKLTGSGHHAGLTRERLIGAIRKRGELSYLAPEARDPTAATTVRADVYSLSAILCEMLAGVVGSLEPTAWKTISDRLPSRVAAVLRKGLSTAPEERFGDVAELLAAVSALVGDTPATPIAIPKKENTATPARVTAARLAATGERAAIAHHAAQLAAQQAAAQAAARASASGERAAARGSRGTQPGMATAPSAAAPEMIEPEKKGGSKLGLILLLAVLLVGVAGFAFWKLRGDGGESTPAPSPTAAAAPAAAAPAAEPKAPDASASEQGESLEVSGQTEPPTAGAKGAQQKHTAVLRTVPRHTKKTRADGPAAPVADAKALKPVVARTAADTAPAEDVAPPPPPDAPPPPAVFTEADKPVETVPPTLVSGPPIEYTDEALRRSITGDVVVTCTITTEGRVRNCKVTKKLPGMDSAVVRALEGRRYKPATRAGKPIDLEYTFRVHVAPPT